MQTTIHQLPIRLNTSRWKNLGLFLFCLLAAVIGVLMIKDGVGWKGWFVAVTFTFGCLVSIILLLPNASYLTIDETGFTVTSLFKSHHIAWENVRQFYPITVRGHHMVGFDFAESYVKRPQWRQLNVEVAGVESALPESYGMTADNLAMLLNVVLAERLLASQ